MAVNRVSTRLFSVIVILMMLIGMASPWVGARSVQAAPQAQTPDPKQAPRPEQPANVGLARLHPDLRKVVEAASASRLSVGNASVTPEEPVFIQAVIDITPGMDAVKSLFVEGKVSLRPFMGLKTSKQGILDGQIMPSRLAKLAARSEVVFVLPVVMAKNGEPDDMPVDDEQPAKKVVTEEDRAALRANAETLRSKVSITPAQAIEPKDWYETSVMGPHKAEAAWDRGVTGLGVTVAVNDDGIDYAHPDLMGTQKIIESGPYAGWPMAFSPFSMLLYYYETQFGTPYISGGYSGNYYADTSTVPVWQLCGEGCRMFEFTPLYDFLTPGYTHTYFFDGSMTKSGEVHVGTHPDITLRDYVWGERPAILVTDPNVAGQYDTVYVDLNDNYDFRDDQPMTKANLAEMGATKNNMIAWLDVTGDGLADISGSMVYFVADGVNPIPVSNWLYTDMAGNPLLVPGAGDLVAFSGGNLFDAYSHGTQCASNIVGQGVTNGLVPDWFKDRDTDTAVTPPAAVLGMAPGAKVVNVGDIYWNFDSSQLDAHLYSAVGHDGCTQAGEDILFGGACTDTDAIQITSNSYGDSGTFNDGWDIGGQFMTQMQRYLAPSLQFTKSTGNGGPGYGTTAPSAPGQGIYVGASTLFGSTGWDNMLYTDQMTYNDIIPFSNRGPSAREGTGVDVLATGAFAAGAVKLNGGSIWGLDGNYAWDSWGGTSRSAPTAAGVLALLYDAFWQGNTRWPTAAEAKAILMSTATDVNYNVFSQGAGSVNADRASLVGLGQYGFYPDVSAWVPGDFRGEDYDGFAHVVKPGQSYTQPITLTNPSAMPITASITTGTPQKIGSKTFTWDLTSTIYANRTTSTNTLRVPQFILPLYAKSPQAEDASWWQSNLGADGIPAGTDLMIVRLAQPYEKFDTNNNYAYDFRTRMILYNWEDANADGLVWHDGKISGVPDGSVDYASVYMPVTVDGIYDLDWSTAEVDQYEYVRYAYSYMTGNHQEVMIQKPLERSTDGIFIGLYVGAGVAPSFPITYTFEVEFYQYSSLPWLEVLDGAAVAPINTITIPAEGTATLTARVNVPADMPVGDYEASIKLFDPGFGLTAPVGANPPAISYPAHTSVIPVTLHVAGEFDGSQNVTLGGADTLAYDEDFVYNNAAVRGYFDWAWREESGDWRFFYVDHTNPVTVLFSEAFEAGVPPAGWTVVDHSGSGYGWKRNTDYGKSNTTGGTGFAADADSDAMGGGMDTSLITPSIDLTGINNPRLTFKSDFQDFAGFGQGWVKVSTDDGMTWTEVLYLTNDTPATTFTVDLSAFTDETIRIAWRFDDEDEWGWYWMIDDVVVGGSSTFTAADHIIVKDTWEDVAPYKTDIDTIVLGPTPSPVDPWGGWMLPDAGYFGPYGLDIVGSSPDVRSGRSVWNFNTSSGANEDWVMVKPSYEDGLYEYLQHNVLFHGNQDSVMFTKTVGTVRSAPEVLNVTAYVDNGSAGTVTLSSTLPFEGLVADAYGLGGPQSFSDVALGFNGTTSFDWTKSFTVTHGAKIEITTSSSTISDIDLALYYCGPSGTSCSQQASSAGATSDETVMVLKPADGIWVMAVDNYSGPAGTFNYEEKIVQGTNLAVAGTTSELIPAGTEKSITVSFNKEGMEVGKTYEGLLLLGNSKAPALIEVPIFVTRARSSAAIEKSVDFDMTFPGENLTYTVNLFNMSDPMATFSLEDPIPAGTSYVPGSVTGGASYDAVGNKIVYNGAIESAAVESFEAGSLLPEGWTRIQNNTKQTWFTNTTMPHSGVYFADILYDDTLGLQDEWLVSPRINPSVGDTVEFWSFGSLTWCKTTYDNCDLNVWLVVDGIGGGDDVLLGKGDDAWTTTWVYAQSVLSLPAILPAGQLQIGFQYYGADGAEVGLDDVKLPGAAGTKTFTYSVKVDGDLAGGTEITNTASVAAKHDLPTGVQVEAAVTAQAVSTVGFPANFSTSYKEAPMKAEPGDVLEYNIHVINTGDAAATISLSDPIPAGTSYYDHDGSIPNQNFAYDWDSDTMVWEGTVAPHSEWVFTFWVEVDAAQPRGTSIVNTAEVTWPVGGLKVITARTLIPVYTYFPVITK